MPTIFGNDDDVRVVLQCIESSKEAEFKRELEYEKYAMEELPINEQKVRADPPLRRALERLRRKGNVY